MIKKKLKTNINSNAILKFPEIDDKFDELENRIQANTTSLSGLSEKVDGIQENVEQNEQELHNLNTNAALKNQDNTFTTTNTFNGVVNVPNPTSENNATNKQYVDSLCNGIQQDISTNYLTKQDAIRTYPRLSVENTYTQKNNFQNFISVIDDYGIRVSPSTNDREWSITMGCQSNHGLITSRAGDIILKPIGGVAKINDDEIATKAYVNSITGQGEPTQVPRNNLTQVQVPYIPSGYTAYYYWIDNYSPRIGTEARLSSNPSGKTIRYLKNLTLARRRTSGSLMFYSNFDTTKFQVYTKNDGVYVWLEAQEGWDNQIYVAFEAIAN